MDRCHCENRVIVRRILKNGVRVFQIQCTNCGKSQSIATKKLTYKQRYCAPPYDPGVRDRYYAVMGPIWDKERQEKWIDWRKAYNNHLQSPTWFAIRSNVMARACGVCEECHTSLAVHAHHLTYERLGHEELSDLIAVCLECHEKIHGKKIG